MSKINRFEDRNDSDAVQTSEFRLQRSAVSRMECGESKTARLNSAKDLVVYKKAYKLAMQDSPGTRNSF